MIQNEKFKLVIFLIYIITYESIVLLGFGYVIFFMNYPLWLLIVMVIVGSLCMKPKSFGLTYENERVLNDN